MKLKDPRDNPTKPTLVTCAFKNLKKKRACVWEHKWRLRKENPLREDRDVMNTWWQSAGDHWSKHASIANI